jgi:ribulose-5-phosphate 4-epimerase/fuculose-1-phosphate aldolase
MSDISDAEREQRINLAACYRIFARYGWDEGIETHISAAVPGTGAKRHFLMNPYGMMFGEITASSLIKVDLDGSVVGESQYRMNPAGFLIHSAIYGAREDITCVVHLHTIAGVAVGAQKRGLLPISQSALFIYNDLAYHAYEGSVLSVEERRQLAVDLGSKHILMLRNHGTLACGHTIAAAYWRMFFLERACQMQIQALSGGADVEELPQAICDRVMDEGKLFPMIGELEWPPILRLLDREDPSFRS